jgi:hypothetical protein
MLATQGGPHVPSTQARSTAAALVRRRLHPADLQALPPPEARGRAHHRTAHPHQPGARRRRTRPGASLQLSPRLLPASLVDLVPGPHLGQLPPATLGHPGFRPVGRRGPGGRASRHQGRRQGPPPRSGPLDQDLHRLARGAEGGRPGDPGPLPVCPAPLGTARPGRAVPKPGVGPRALPAPQDPRTPAPSIDRRAPALVPAPPFHPRASASR